MINQKQEDDAMKSKKAKAATKRGVVSAPVCSALNKPWVVAEAGAKYFIDAVWGGKPVRYESTCEDMSILTESGEEVIGCSEWMRANREVFDHIVSLHNANLPNNRMLPRLGRTPLSG